MDSAVTWNVNQYMLMGLALGLFGLVGFRRGVNRELLLMIGIALGMWLSSQVAPSLESLVNRLYRMGHLALGGGLTGQDPTAAWQSARELPDLIRTPEDLQMLGLALFILVVACSYLLGQRRFPQPDSTMLRILGSFAGAINGFLVSYHLFPIVLAKPTAVISLPSGQVQEALTSGQTIARMVALFVFVLIAFGLYSASRSKKRE